MEKWRRLARRSVALPILCIALLPAFLAAQDVELNVIERTLKNGMKFLLVERHDKPTVALYLQFKVGGVDDPKGKTGIAHLLEHMMFKGTKTYGTTNFAKEAPLIDKIDKLYAELERERAKSASLTQKPDQTRITELQEQMQALQKEQEQYIVTDELWQTYQRLGGVGLNASTGDDTTQYFVSLPSNQLEIWAMLESDRIANPVFREFYPERDVVHEERRMRTDNQPAGLLWENFAAMAFLAHPYRNPVVGWASDIDSMRREEVLQYFKTFYAPNNCIAAIVGDIDPDKTMAVMEKYFGPIPAQPQPRRNITAEPPQQGERRLVLSMEAQPELYIAYHIPPIGDPDTYALDALASLLSGVTRSSRTGRLYRSLVLDKRVALAADASSSTQLYPSLFVISATPAQGKTAAEVEQAVYEELARIQKEPPSDEEMTRVRNAVDANFIRQLRSDMGVARMITYVEYIAGTWRYLLTEREKLKTVTAEQVQAVAQKYFDESNRTVGELRQKASPQETAPAPPEASEPPQPPSQSSAPPPSSAPPQAGQSGGGQ
jgi:predicted Zn-dependent peptidase